jgi:putative ATP-binding cassette transporter
VRLSNAQLQKEADFRFELAQVREHAESLALVQGERTERARLGDRLTRLVDNYREVIGVLRNLKFLTGGYNYLTQLIPVLIVVPLYLKGEVEFGVVTQSAMAFSQVFNAFSLIVEQFQNLSAYAAVIGRLGSLEEAIRDATEPARRPIRVEEKDDHLAYRRLTVRGREGERDLVRDLDLEVPRGRRVLVVGPNDAGKRALLRATAGLWDRGSGRVVRPARRHVLFLPQWPYMVPGTLREQFLTAVPEGELSDERVLSALREVGLARLACQDGCLDAEQDWRAALSLGEQQLVAIARLLVAEPAFAFLDRAASALSDARREGLFELLSRTAITYVTVGDGDEEPGLAQYHDLLLELNEDGTWKAEPAHAAAGKR